MSNEGIYSLGKDLVKQNTTFFQIESFASISWDGLTYKTHMKSSKLAWHFIFQPCGSFMGKLFVRHLRNPFVHPFKLESSHSSLKMTCVCLYYVQCTWLTKPYLTQLTKWFMCIAQDMDIYHLSIRGWSPRPQTCLKPKKFW